VEALSADGLLSPADALRDLDAVAVDPAVAADVAHGKVLERERLGTSGDGPWAVVGEDGALLAVYEPHQGTTAKPTVVLANPTPS
jgi:hypothetical protein